MTMQIQICCSTEFPLDLNTGDGNLSEINSGACSNVSQLLCVAGSAEVDDRGAYSCVARVNTPAVPLSVPLAVV